MLSMLPEELSDFPRSSSEKINTITVGLRYNSAQNKSVGKAGPKNPPKKRRT